jgi:Ca2+-binding RTX toxin-like protein
MLGFVHGLSATPAIAAELSFTVDGLTGVLVYEAAPGEANDVAIAGPDLQDLIHVSDSGAVITVSGPGCVSVTPNRVDCLFPWPDVQDLKVEVRAGDGDDRVSDDVCEIGSVRILGQAGADTLVSGSFHGMIRGGTGPDVMDARPGICNEGGNVWVSYDDRREPVFVTLDGRANDGGAGEGDTLGNGVYWVMGGRADDFFKGNSGPNTLQGLGGADRILGLGGPDQLEGGGGPDRIRGGTGGDFVWGGWGDDLLWGDRGGDEIDGAQGDDVLHGGGGNDAIYSGPGVDRPHGGEGADVIRLRDTLAEIAFGGPGVDTAHVDFGLDRTFGIERLCGRVC